MNESDGHEARTPFHLCMMAEEQDEAMTDVMEIANVQDDLDLNRAVAALADIHDLVKSYLAA